MTSTVDRTVEDLTAPPHSTEAEEAVLGAVLKQGLALVEVAPFLRPEHFYRPQHRQVYAAMLALFEQGQPIDYHTLLEELRRQGTEESSGGLSFLAELSLATPTAAHIERYARIVVDHATTWARSRTARKPWS
jgi:replicative DNA helicase